MRVGQPSVNRHTRHLGCKANEKQNPDEMSQASAIDKTATGGLRSHRYQVEMMPSESPSKARVGRVEIHHEDADEHENAGCESVDEELHRGVAAVVPTPDEDE